MRNFRLELSYDGSRYRGWQRQGNTGTTVQGKLEETLSRMLGQNIEVHGAGRTDAGVHARQQTASFRADTGLSCDALLSELRAHLPEDIGAVSLTEASERFHARLNCAGKTYVYRIWNGSVMPPQKRDFEILIDYPLDMERMKQGASLLVGEHDFKAFRSSGGMNLSTVRTVYQVSFEVSEYPKESGQEIQFSVTGNGFLYNMVRIMVGTLLEIGSGKREITDIQNALETGERSFLGPTAPAKGLWLFSVEYEEKNL